VAAKLWVRPDTPRLTIKARPWTWRTPGEPDEHGVALVISTSQIIQFLNLDQAVELSNLLIDAVENQTEGTAS
jgi:hypothetical protein